MRAIAAFLRLRSYAIVLMNFFGASMLGLVTIHLFVGMLLGFCLTVFILIPITAITLVEAILLQPAAGSWSSMVWRIVVLIVAVEVGYILGAALRGFKLRARIPNASPRQKRGLSRSKRSNVDQQGGQ